MWLDELQSALRDGLHRTTAWPNFDDVMPPADYRAQVTAGVEERVALARQAQQEEHMNALFVPPNPSEVRANLVREWLGPAPRRAVLRRVYRRILAAGVEAPAEARRFLDAALRALLNLPVEPPDGLQWPVIEAALQTVNQWSEDTDVLRYAEEVGIMDRGITTAAGRVLTRLTGRDAVRWILTNELLQSTGAKDEWRLSRATIEYLIATPQMVVWQGGLDAEEGPWFPYAWTSILRLERLGLLWTSSDPELQQYEVWPEGLALLEELRSGDHPAQAVLGALLEQASAARMDDSSVVPGTERRAAEWVVETMAHGLRNALGPANFALDQMTSGPDWSETETQRLARARTGVKRAFKLVEDLVALYGSSQSPPQTFDAAAVVEDAVAIANGSDVGRSLDAIRGTELHGQRLRLVHALAEVIRNARRHGRPDGRVAVVVSGHRTDSTVVIHVDDDGRGVDPDLRTRVFERGFSTVPDGTGQGLALLQEVVCGEYRGTVRVEESGLGGARFVLELPTA